MDSQKSTEKSAHHEHSEACRETRQQRGDERQDERRHDDRFAALEVRYEAPNMRARDDADAGDAREHALVLCRKREIAFGDWKYKTYA